jgi:hypothetical protein
MTGIDIFADVGSLDKKQVEVVPRFVGDYEAARLLWLNKVRAQSICTAKSFSARDAILRDRNENHS